jgi:NAD+ diphosphatase
MKYCPQCGTVLVTKNVDGANRLTCASNACNFIYWNNPVPVVAALVAHEEKYILARNTAWPMGIFSVITGYLEQGENPEHAVVREVKEELGLDARAHNLIGNYIFSEKNQLIIAYEVHATGKLVTNHELAEIKHLSPAELIQYDFHPLYITKNIVRDWNKLNLS